MDVEICQNIEALEPDGFVNRDASAELDAQFTALVERRSRFVFRVAYAILKNPQDAEDAVQETFLKLYRTGWWKSMADEKAFLARTTWRIAVDHLPRKKSESLDAQTPSSGDNPEAQAIHADWNALVHALVDALPEELRQPLALSTVEDLTSREIGVVMGIPEGTVRSRLMRARQILKQKIGSALGDRHEK
jgi:RNA polymerase sigma-70 factor, ECF subfamily